MSNLVRNILIVAGGIIVAWVLIEFVLVALGLVVKLFVPLTILAVILYFLWPKKKSRRRD